MTSKCYKGKRYAVGMYGGKFVPFHKGHAHCIDVASGECEVLYVPIFYSVADEIIYQDSRYDYRSRIQHILKYISGK